MDRYLFACYQLKQNKMGKYNQAFWNERYSQTELKGAVFSEAYESTTELTEGSYHIGKASVIRIFATKNRYHEKEYGNNRQSNPHTDSGCYCGIVFH